MAKIKYIIISWLALCLSFSPVQAKLFGAQSFMLDNGLQVVVAENHKAPVVKYMLWYKAGAVDEKKGKGGSAHLLEHLMFRGTTKVSGEMFDDILKQNGVESNAFTTLDFTSYYHTLDVSKLELVMALEADRMENLQISPEHFALERDIVYQERKQVVDNNPAAPFAESFRKVLWQEHPYSRSVSGTEGEIKSLTLSDVEDFYNAFYTPDNAILVLAGDIDLQTAKDLAQKYYGQIEKRADVSKKATFPKVNAALQAQISMNLPQINTPRLVKTYVAPSFNADKNDIYNLAVFSKYVGDGETSELYKDLVLKQKKALSVSSSYDYTARSYGTFSISALPADGTSPQELELLIDEAVKKAVQNLNIDKINSTKDKMLSGLVYLQDNPFDAADTLGSMTAAGMSVTDIENHAEKIREVTYQDVKEAAEKLLSQTAVVTGILSPKGEN